ncbi:MAG: sulfatase-like hydrolase/transferase [Planctomycetes bacterium]|nr:sulfatase-like hydrolase/transferase [Planctomycetota bacterium]
MISLRQPGSKMNVLLITADQMRKDHLGCYGNPLIRTPNLDRLAAEGVCLNRAYVSNPLCMPNRSTIATGRLPRNHRCWSNGIALPLSEPTVADIVNGRGYHTALLGKGHLSCFGAEDQSFDIDFDSRCSWLTGRRNTGWTGPYYGFSECQLAIGHGDNVLQYGHYGAWLERNFPGAAKQAIGNHIASPTGAAQCFTLDLPVEAHSSTWVGDIGCDYLQARASDGKPFLCWLSFPDPHHPFCPPRPFDTMYAPDAVAMPRFGLEALADRPEHFRQAYQGGQEWEGMGENDFCNDISEPQMREIIARTYGMITLMDQNIGRVLQVLRQTGLEDETVVIFTSDHGDLMGDCGLLWKGPFLLEGLINVPMIWRVPGATGGVRCDGLFSSCDIAPTILDLLGVNLLGAMDGVAQGELVRGGPGKRRATVVEFKSMYRRELNLRSIITAARKLTHYAGLACGELYDMTADVPEAHNLYENAAFAADRAVLERMLLDLEIASEDGLLQPTSHA